MDRWCEGLGEFDPRGDDFGGDIEEEVGGIEEEWEEDGEVV